MTEELLALEPVVIVVTGMKKTLLLPGSAGHSHTPSVALGPVCILGSEVL